MNFSPGEIAVLCNLILDQACFNGMEVTVDGTAHWPAWYRISAPWLTHGLGMPPFMVHGRHLRRRPSPPDWNALAMGKSKPRELEPA